MPTLTPAIWVLSTDERWNNAGAVAWPALYTPAQQARLERLRQAALLFDGKHRDYFLREDRSQFEFPQVRLTSGRTITMYSTCNALKLISLKSADLLIGQEALLRSTDKVQQQYVEDLAERTALHDVLYSGALECSYQGETYLESSLLGGLAYLSVAPAAEIFPVGPMLPNRQFAQYVRYELANAGTDDNPQWRLLQTTYAIGRITREVWALNAQSRQREQRLAMEQWPLALLPEEQLTGIAANTITFVPNLLQRGMPVSDYDGVIDLQDELNAKQTQLAYVIGKHAYPRLAAPESKADEDGNLPASAEVYFYRSKDEIPQYITWSAELDAAMRDRDFALNQLLVQTETSPVLLGLKQGAAPDSYKKVRLEAFNSLTKAARKAIHWKSAIRRAIGVCLDLQLTVPGHRFDRVPMGVQMRDGIPVDESELANTQATLRSVQLLSVEAALEERYGGDEAAVRRELQRLEQERRAATPTVLLGASDDTDAAVRDAGANDTSEDDNNDAPVNGTDETNS